MDYFAILCFIETCKYIIPINLALNVYPNPSSQFHLLVKNVASKNSSKENPVSEVYGLGERIWPTTLIWSRGRFDWWFVLTGVFFIQ